MVMVLLLSRWTVIEHRSGLGMYTDFRQWETGCKRGNVVGGSGGSVLWFNSVVLHDGTSLCCTIVR